MPPPCGSGRHARFVAPTDRDSDQLAHLVDAAIAEFGRLDILVNNAGGWMPRPFLETSQRNLEAALRFNVTSAFVLSQLAVPHMVAGGGGAIVNISSRSASMVQPAFTAYATAKAALSMLTRAMAPELAPKVRVNAIEVGGVETAALESVLTDPAVREQLEANTPMHRVGQPGRHRRRGRVPRVGCVELGDRQDLRDRRRRGVAGVHGPGRRNRSGPATDPDSRSVSGRRARR